MNIFAPCFPISQRLCAVFDMSHGMENSRLVVSSTDCVRSNRSNELIIAKYALTWTCNISCLDKWFLVSRLSWVFRTILLRTWLSCCLIKGHPPPFIERCHNISIVGQQFCFWVFPETLFTHYMLSFFPRHCQHWNFLHICKGFVRRHLHSVSMHVCLSTCL